VAPKSLDGKSVGWMQHVSGAEDTAGANPTWRLPLDQVAEGCRAMDERRAINTLLTV
jgi:hypothetical protein